MEDIVAYKDSITGKTSFTPIAAFNGIRSFQSIKKRAQRHLNEAIACGEVEIISIAHSLVKLADI